ncbi:rhodanese-like domain-containing protein [Candidatus Nitronereus thalassa]|uniref:Rhodanese-like domain-containing protein n=1 Tax=Candidatus Nitronereus thalassa TaxID=3020898 RepID=A0ABU3K7M6_9BACT|nr:rhodanese-like domain-containing protein [Candidatus Nitronereus thalassa]MDT7042394.1 rhodanese-like domain-containing protein [Candidatus Nitronereus thalassa]
MMETAVQEKVYPWVRAQDILHEGKVRADFQVVDVRTPAEFQEAHVPGAVNIPLADIPAHLSELKAKSEEKPIVFMCRTQNRIKLAYDQLPQPNHCHLLEGGITAWKTAGHPVVQGQRAISLEGQVRMAAGVLIVVGTLLGVAVNPWFLLLPAGVGLGLFHAGYTDSCLMGMVLAKLPFNRK